VQLSIEAWIAVLRADGSWPLIAAVRHYLTQHVQVGLMTYWLVLGATHFYRIYDEARTRQLPVAGAVQSKAQGRLCVAFHPVARIARRRKGGCPSGNGMKIRALIVDDEPLGRRGVLRFLRNDPEIEVVAQCSDGQAAVEAILARNPDLVFLDIQMPEMDGFEVVRRVGPQNMPVTIFVTAYDRYAVRAFDANAIDYLLKPVGQARFERALARFRDSKLAGISAAINRLRREGRCEWRHPGETMEAGPERPACRHAYR
jgi:CheY-like chemotaxis protein